ncbi:unnamed protein product [Polarella glacialis]|uniref:Uncharacterized protein n=1 Tax=Polarella glacialis TaxID=89957 RepID=A0A813IJZ2_POLGL|nr:unnamed protein product [Polarella glacialis]
MLNTQSQLHLPSCHDGSLVEICVGLQHTLHDSSLVVGVGSALGPTLDNADKAAVVHEALLGAASHLLLLLGLGNLWRLVLHLTGTRQTSVNLAHDDKG